MWSRQVLSERPTEVKADDEMGITTQRDFLWRRKMEEGDSLEAGEEEAEDDVEEGD